MDFESGNSTDFMDKFYAERQERVKQQLSKVVVDLTFDGPDTLDGTGEWVPEVVEIFRQLEEGPAIVL